VHIPTSFKLIILKKNEDLGHKNYIHFVAYNNKHRLYFVILKSKVFFDIELYSLVIHSKKIDVNKNFYEKYFSKFLKLIEKYVFLKIKFKGKGFRIKIFRKLKIIKFYFGRSHITFFKFRKLKIKKVTKYKFLLKSLNPLKFKQICTKVIKIKPMNVFTLRGLRISKQIIYKRKGKKGSYI
jgi:hypothetical protein